MLEIRNLLIYLCSQEKLIEKLYDIIFGKIKENISQEELAKISTSKLTENWKNEISDISNIYKKFNGFKKTLLHSNFYFFFIDPVTFNLC